MPTSLPSVAQLTNRTVTKGQFKSAMAQLIAFLTGTLGTTGVPADARSALGFLEATVSPAQITATQNDYNPTGLSTAQALRINSDARRSVTGLQTGSVNRVLSVHNIGTFPIVFKAEDAGSTAANRLTFGQTLGGGQSMIIQYDPTSLRWRPVSLPEPIGTIKSFGGGTVPEGFLLRDGSNISRTTYASLFNEVGTTWGVGDGSTTFGVGDDRRKVDVGSGGSGTGTLGNAVGNTGGAETHTLTTAEMPAHDHDMLGYNNPSANSGLLAGGGAQATTNTTDIQNTGGGGAHNNIQPSNVVTKIIRFQ